MFWKHFCQLFYFKMPTSLNSIQSDAPFPKYSTSIMIPLLASIVVKKFSRKCLHLRENFLIFAKMQKQNFRFGPNGNWILTLPHICLFILLKRDVMAKKLHHMYHACRITVKFKRFFAKFLWDFRENFRENEKSIKLHFRFNPKKICNEKSASFAILLSTIARMVGTFVRRRFGAETFCYSRRFVMVTFCYGGVLW
jgi:hypothetical protein